MLKPCLAENLVPVYKVDSQGHGCAGRQTLAAWNQRDDAAQDMAFLIASAFRPFTTSDDQMARHAFDCFTSTGGFCDATVGGSFFGS